MQPQHNKFSALSNTKKTLITDKQTPESSNSISQSPPQYSPRYSPRYSPQYSPRYSPQYSPRTSTNKIINSTVQSSTETKESISNLVTSEVMTKTTSATSTTSTTSAISATIDTHVAPILSSSISTESKSISESIKSESTESTKTESTKTESIKSEYTNMPTQKQVNPNKSKTIRLLLSDGIFRVRIYSLTIFGVVCDILMNVNIDLIPEDTLLDLPVIKNFTKEEILSIVSVLNGSPIKDTNSIYILRHLRCDLTLLCNYICVRWGSIIPNYIPQSNITIEDALFDLYNILNYKQNYGFDIFKMNTLYGNTAKMFSAITSRICLKINALDDKCAQKDLLKIALNCILHDQCHNDYESLKKRILTYCDITELENLNVNFVKDLIMSINADTFDGNYIDRTHLKANVNGDYYFLINSGNNNMPLVCNLQLKNMINFANGMYELCFKYKIQNFLY